MTVAIVSPDDYVREVLPATYELWGGRRTFEKYVADFRAVAESPYGKRRPFTLGFPEDGRIVCSCKNYDRTLHWDNKTLRATGIGAVFTDPVYRGRGYATAMLGALLDRERADGRDFAYLFSDIHPAYYERLGFVSLPSRVLTLRAASLDGSPVGGEPLQTRDWPAVRRCFEALEARRPWGFKRTPLVWEFMRQSWAIRLGNAMQPVNLVVRRNRSVVAYAIARRALPDDTLIVDDYGFASEEGRAVLPGLLRAAAGDLRRVSGWLPPSIARDALPRGSVKARRSGIFMIAPLSSLARTWWRENKEAILADRADPIWSADHV